MPKPEAIIEAADLRVVFFRRDDRYAHAIEARVGGEWKSTYESLEGTGDEVWPPSPPFQSLHVERRPTGDVILLVGMAGKTHWSAAVEAVPDGRGISFDVAARYQALPLRLGSDYSTAGGDRRPAIKFVAAAGRIEATSIRPAGAPITPPATACWKYVVTSNDVT